MIYFLGESVVTYVGSHWGVRQTLFFHHCCFPSAVTGEEGRLMDKFFVWLIEILVKEAPATEPGEYVRHGVAGCGLETHRNRECLTHAVRSFLVLP